MGQAAAGLLLGDKNEFPAKMLFLGKADSGTGII